MILVLSSVSAALHHSANLCSLEFLLVLQIFHRQLHRSFPRARADFEDVLGRLDLWHRQVVPDKEFLVWRVELLLSKNRDGRLSVEWLCCLHHEFWIAHRVAGVWVEWGRQIFVLLVAKMSNAVLAKDLLDTLNIVLSIHGPEWVNLSTSCFQNALKSARVVLNKIRNIVDSISVCHPNTFAWRVMLFYLGELDDRLSGLGTRGKLLLLGLLLGWLLGLLGLASHEADARNPEPGS
mmetsp:Transcript_58347/g.103705  ORF Transcript_58347/g.103705 Transcript_58347/m.103705 type:complete len:236 (+) Transcript_58347:994-1701(+)